MRILYITTLFDQKASSASIRNNSLVKGLVEIGHEVVVMTVQWPDFLLSDFFEQHKCCPILKEHIKVLDLLKYTNTHTAKRLSWKARIRGIVRDVLFFPDICREWISKVDVSLASKFDLIISSSDNKTSHFVAKKLKKENRNILWIQIWGDPWEEDIHIQRFLKPIVRRKENLLLKQGDKIVYVSKPTQLLMQKKYPLLKNKMFYVPRGYYLQSEYQKHNEEVYTLIYTGVLSGGRKIDILFEALDQYNYRALKKIILECYGNYPIEIQQQASRFSFVRLYGTVDYGDIPKILGKADGLLFISNANNSTQIPGKIFDYMSATAPILCLVESLDNEVAHFLQEIRRCCVVQNIKNAIEFSLPSYVEMMKEKFDPDEYFSPRSIARQIIDLIKK